MAAVLVIDGRVVYSASDLAAAARCEYALLRAFDAKLGRGSAVSAGDDLLARTAALGDAHEQRHLELLRAQAGGEVAVIGRPTAPYTVAGLTAAAEATTRAVDARAPLIYQAAMFDGRFIGFADFLVFDGGRYRVGDTKLARSAKVEALLQLAAYADALAAAGVPVAEEAELVLGTGAVMRYRVDELVPVYRSRRTELQRLLDTHLDSGGAVHWEDAGVRACFRCPECNTKVRDTDDLLLVANMKVSQLRLREHWPLSTNPTRPKLDMPSPTATARFASPCIAGKAPCAAEETANDVAAMQNTSANKRLSPMVGRSTPRSR